MSITDYNPKVIEWLKDIMIEHPEYLNYIEHKHILYHLYEKYSEDFVAAFELKWPVIELGGERITADYKNKLFTLELWKGLGYIGNNKFHWRRFSPYVGINELILKLALRNEFTIKVMTKDDGEFFVMPEVIKTALENQWVAKTAKRGLKVYAVPISMTPRKIKEQRNQLITAYY